MTDTTSDRIHVLQGMLAQRDTVIAERDRRIAELEKENGILKTVAAMQKDLLAKAKTNGTTGS